MKRIVMFLAIASFFPFVAYAYDVAAVKNGGNIEGIVEFAGSPIPKDEQLKLTSDTGYCGETIQAEKYLISEDGRVKNVVVYLTGIKAGKAVPAETVAVTNLKCAFVPHVSVGYRGNKLILKNDDPFFHTFDIHASQGGRELYHVSMYEKGLSVAKTMTRPGLMELSCYVHPWQRAYIYVFDHPYAALTDDRGEFVIKDVPPGTYTVEAWHEALGIIKIPDVKVESGKTSTIKLDYRAR